LKYYEIKYRKDKETAHIRKARRRVGKEKGISPNMHPSWGEKLRRLREKLRAVTIRISISPKNPATNKKKKNISLSNWSVK
jgi:hypothetical protein